jgi:hypothetical protein
VSADNRALAGILNNNQLGILMQMNSSLPFNIISNRDLNNDGFGSDRPVNVARNSMYLPARYNVDMRYSRFVPFRGNLRAEVIGELKNVFNTVQWSGVTSTIAVDTLGNPLAPIPGRPQRDSVRMEATSSANSSSGSACASESRPRGTQVCRHRFHRPVTF